MASTPGSRNKLLALTNDAHGGKRPTLRKSTPVTQAESTFKGRQTKRRNKFDASPDGLARMSSPIKPQGSMSMADTYKANGYEDDAPHPMGQQELPGMSTLSEARKAGLVSAKGGHGSIPDVERQPKWEDMHPTAQAHVLRQASMYGVTKSSASAAFGAQLDQAYHRGGSHGQSAPAGADFYSNTGDLHDDANLTPRGRLVKSAKENNVPMSAQVLANAQTSPQARFRAKSRTSGETMYPNDMNATAAIKHVQAGLPASTARNAPGAGGFHGNVARAAHAYEQQTTGGHTVDELTNPGGGKILGPKTGAYHGAWTAPHNSTGHLTSDIHTGGGGFAPHLGIPEREDYLNISGIHALHDHIARQEMAKRGLQSVHHAQAAQWGEERINRGLSKEKDEYPARNTNQRQFSHPGQEGLF